MDSVKAKQYSNHLEFGDISKTIKQIVESNEWSTLQESFNYSENIGLVGHGGNLAVADHMSADITRLTDFKKSTFCPGSAIMSTSFINDSNFDQWMVLWLKSIINSLNFDKTLLIGISSSGRSNDIANLFLQAKKYGIKTALITAKKSFSIEKDIEVVTNTESYHSSEIVALALGYQLVHGFGHTCPVIK